MSDTFRVDDQMMLLAKASVHDDMINDLLLIIVIFLRKKDVLCAVRDAAPESNITGVTSHNFNDTASLVRGRSILDLVDGFHSSIDCCVKADRVICTCDVEVDRSGNADRVDPVAGKSLRAAVRTVAADDNDTVDTVFVADLRSSLLHFLFLELRASGCAQYGTALMDDTCDINGFHLVELFVEKALVTSLNSDHFALIVHRFSRNCTDRRVHSGSVSATC